MSWITPKLDWTSSDWMNYGDWNRIENNIYELHSYLQSIQYAMPTGNNPYALELDGINGCIAFPDAAIPAGTNYTVECLAKRTGYDPRSNYNNVFGWGALSLPKLQVAYNNATSTFYFGGWGTDAGTVVPFTLDTWFHISVVVTSNVAKLYINGVDAGVGVSVASVAKSSMYVGRLTNLDSAVGAFVGSVDEFRVWNVARTQAEIQSGIGKYLLGDETGLIGYWKMNEGQGTTVNDVVSKNSGTLQNGVSWVTSAPDKSNQDVYKDRDNYSIDFLSSINRIENNLDNIRLAFVSPADYLPKKTWIVGRTFDYTDANRLEGNTSRLLQWGMSVYQSYRYCGTFICGESGGLE